MCHSTFSILNDDLNNIDIILQSIDPGYVSPAHLPELSEALLVIWSSKKYLGPPTEIRYASIYAGPWTPDIVSIIPGNTSFQDATLRVMGLRIMLRQLGFLLLPFWQTGGPISIWERLLVELSIIDFFSLEEAVFDGNAKSKTISLVEEWKTSVPAHPAATLLEQSRSTLNPSRYQWDEKIRNKVCAHMDLNVPATMLDPKLWPMDTYEFNREIEKLCKLIGKMANADIRTKFLTIPVKHMSGVQSVINRLASRWIDT